jgi:hypothetical protein
MIAFIHGCHSKGTSPDNLKPFNPLQLPTDSYLSDARGRALEYFGLGIEDGLTVGWGDLNPEGVVKFWGSFYGVNPVEESYIVIDVSMKGESHYERLYVMGHEVCHYMQWRRGVIFDLGFLEWGDRWYEQECVSLGQGFLIEMINRGETDYEGL